MCRGLNYLFVKCYFLYRFAGVVVFTDVVLPLRVTLCNRTLGQAECLNGQCYMANRKCDGHHDCSDGTDEALCKL